MSEESKQQKEAPHTPYLPTELWMAVVEAGDPLSNYTSLRATNKFFKGLVEDDFKKRFCQSDMRDVRLYMSCCSCYCRRHFSTKIRLKFRGLTHHNTRAVFVLADPFRSISAEDMQIFEKIASSLGSDIIPNWALARTLFQGKEYAGVGYHLALQGEIEMLLSQEEVPLYGFQARVEDGEASVEWMPIIAAALRQVAIRPPSRLGWIEEE